MTRTGLVLLLLLVGCARSSMPPTRQARADAETEAACRQRAEQVYDVRHRADIYSPPPEVNAPFSANYVPGLPDRNLAALHEHNQLVSDCIRNTGAESIRPGE